MKYYVVDVFTDSLFGGNPAGVCLPGGWPPDAVMQNIAAENNLSETAFLVKRGGYYDLRWFTPSLEVSLCGHATMAGASVLFEEVETSAEKLDFKTLSGTLSVIRKNGLYYLDFPARNVVPRPAYPVIEKALGVKPLAVYYGLDFLVTVKDENVLRGIEPDFEALKGLKAEAGTGTDDFGVIVTAAGGDCDFVSRFFGPNVGVNEDPVTGRAHCSLIPFWGGRLGKRVMFGKQVSKRGGSLYCEYDGENQPGGGRVKIGGKTVRYLNGEILLP